MSSALKILIPEFRPAPGVNVEALKTSSAWLVTADAPGPCISVFGGVHGNEPCGIQAVSELLRAFAGGTLSLTRGSLLLCLANEEAIDKGVRAVEDNMNRMFEDGARPKGAYMRRRVEELKRLLEGSDIHLDLHSTSQPSRPFIFVETEYFGEISDMPLPYLVTLSKRRMEEEFPGTTQSFARRCGARAYTIENGQHDDPGSRSSALEITLEFLARAGAVAGRTPRQGAPKVLEQFLIYTKRSESFSFAGPLASFQELEAGEVIASDAGETLRAPERCFVVLPTLPEGEPLGAYLFLLAREVAV